MSTNDSSWLQTVGNYMLLEQIGQGATGTVHKARHQQTGQLVAIKILGPLVARNAVLLKRFEQEFRVASRLDHPNIVRVLEYSGSGPSPYLVMELIEGESVGEKLDREGRMTEDEAIYIIVQVAHGLHRAHRQGLIHRDIKPDNILLTREGQAKLTDLGLAKDKDSDGENLTRTGASMGTPDYMAPEQFRNAKNVDIPCDVYGLGATLYHMVTGKLPFEAKSPMLVMRAKVNNEMVLPRQHVPELSERTERAICLALSVEPRDRPASCRAFVEQLTGLNTRPTMQQHTKEADDVWFVVYQDAEGKNRTTKGTTETIRDALRAGHMGDVAKVRCGRSQQGPFNPANQYAELMQHAAAAVFKATDTVRMKVREESVAPIAPVKPQLPENIKIPSLIKEESTPLAPIPKQSTWLTLACLLFGVLAVLAVGSYILRPK